MLPLACSQPVGLLVTISFSSSRVRVTRCPHSNLMANQVSLSAAAFLVAPEVWRASHQA
jgi:hypothetical protein